MLVRSLVVGFVVASLVASPARSQAVLNLLVGRKLAVRDRSAGADATRRRVVVTVQQQGGFLSLEGDPTAHGASFAIEVGAVHQIWSLPASNWRAIRSGFSYADSLGLNGPVRRLKIRHDARDVFLIKASLSGAKAPLDVVPPNPGTEGGIAVVMDAGQTYCAWYGGVAGGVVQNDGARVFDVRNPTGPGPCPSDAYPTTTTVPTTTTTSSTSASTTTSTSSTTTTIVGPPCGEIQGSPMCAGDCPPDTPICADLGGNCQCVSGTQPCGGQRAPTCDGTCPAGQVCVSGVFDCGCMPVGSTPCFTGGGDGPVCGGFCPPDEACVYVDLPTIFQGCLCSPPGCSIPQPPPLQSLCGASCPPGRHCESVPITSGFSDCLCLE
jgi:hypothetical protein